MRIFLIVWVLGAFIAANPLFASPPSDLLARFSDTLSPPTTPAATRTSNIDLPVETENEGNSSDTSFIKPATATPLSSVAQLNVPLHRRGVNVTADFEGLKKDISSSLSSAVEKYIQDPDNGPAQVAIKEITSASQKTKNLPGKANASGQSCDDITDTSADLPTRISCIRAALGKLKREIQSSIQEDFCVVDNAESILQQIYRLFGLPSDGLAPQATTATATPTSRPVLCDKACSACMKSIIRPGSLATRDMSETKHKALGKRAVLKPADFGGDMSAFILKLVEQSEVVPLAADHSKQKVLPSGEFHTLENKEYSMAVEDLYGCTSVVFVSQMGIGMYHFWERPAFAQKTWDTKSNWHLVAPDSELEKEVLDPMANGGTHITAVLPLIQRGGFMPQYKPRAFIVTPPGATQGSVRYERAVSKIQDKLRHWMPGSPQPEVVTYTRLNPFAKGPGDQPKGKVVVQYDPSEHFKLKDGCLKQMAGLKVWVEDRAKPVFGMPWEAYDFQLVTTASRKRENLCPASASETVLSSSTH